jgi:hypothetical protein
MRAGGGWRMLALVALAPTAGCLMLPTGTYYRPSYPGTAAYGVVCMSRGLGPKHYVDIAAPAGVSLTASVDIRDSGRVPTSTLRVRIHKAPGTAVRFVADYFTVTGPYGQRFFRHNANGVTPAEEWRTIEYDVTGLRDDFTLVLPALEIDGQTFSPEPIVFRYRRHDWAVYPFNC